MNTIKTISLLLLLTTLLSCSEDFFNKPIDLDIDDHTSKLAATAILGIDDASDAVLVSYSIGPFEENSTQQIINEATLTITGNNDVFNFAPMAQNNFFLANTSLDFVPNASYTFNITAPNYESISATQIYPTAVPILEASINENKFKIKINDTANTEDYYVLRLYKEDVNNPGVFYSKWIDPFGRQTKNSGFCDECVVFTDATFNGESNVEIVVTHGYYNPDTTYKAVLYHVTEDFFRYDQTLRVSEYAQDNPFVEPVILHRNFNNGYGIFALVNKTELIFNN